MVLPHVRRMKNLQGKISGNLNQNLIAYYEVEGLEELKDQIRRLEKIPKKLLTKTAKVGSDKPLKEAKANMPEGKTGLLKKGLKRVMEKGKRRTKSVYRIHWDKKLTSAYLKKTTGVYGGKTPHAYYPHSVEYGFKSKHRRIEGQYIAKKAIENNEVDSLKKMVKTLQDGIDDLIK